MTFDASCSQNAQYYIWEINGSFLWQDINGNYSTHTEKSFGISLDISTYKVTLYTYNSDSSKTVDTVSHTFAMDNSSTACFTINGSSASNGSYPVNTSISFDASCSSNYDPATCEWSFDGGQLKNGNNVTHTFTTTGSHTADLQVRDPSRTGGGYIEKTFTIY